MKTFIGVILAISLVLGWPSAAYAIEQPVAPNIENVSSDKANNLITKYNEKVIEYNTWAQEQNQLMAEEYRRQKQEVDNHNLDQEQLVLENQALIQEQEERLSKIKVDTDLGFKYQFKDGEKFSDNALDYIVDNPLTISEYETPQDNRAGVPAVNIHLYLKDDNIPILEPGVGFDTFSFAGLDDYILAEIEGVLVDPESSVDFDSELNLLGTNAEPLYRSLEGYTNGYWDVTYTHFGYNTQFDYLNGPTDKINTYPLPGEERGLTVNVYYYTFVRTGPEIIEPYVPQYLEYPHEPTYLPLLETMNYVEIPSVQEEVMVERPKPIGSTLPATGDNNILILLGTCGCLLGSLFILMAIKIKNSTK